MKRRKLQGFFLRLLGLKNDEYEVRINKTIGIIGSLLCAIVGFSAGLFRIISYFSNHDFNNFLGGATEFFFSFAFLTNLLCGLIHKNFEIFNFIWMLTGFIFLISTHYFLGAGLNSTCIIFMYLIVYLSFLAGSKLKYLYIIAASFCVFVLTLIDFILLPTIENPITSQIAFSISLFGFVLIIIVSFVFWQSSYISNIKVLENVCDAINTLKFDSPEILKLKAKSKFNSPKYIIYFKHVIDTVRLYKTFLPSMGDYEQDDQEEFVEKKDVKIKKNGGEPKVVVKNAVETVKKRANRARSGSLLSWGRKSFSDDNDNSSDSSTEMKQKKKKKNATKVSLFEHLKLRTKEITYTSLCIQEDEYLRIIDDHTPESIVEFHNKYFDVVHSLVEKHKGKIISFSFDKIQFSFNGIMQKCVDHAFNACETAFKISRSEKLRMEEFNINLKIAITTGKSFVGALGNSFFRRLNFVGRPVLLNRRVLNFMKKDKLLKKYSIIIDENTRESVKFVFKTKAVNCIPFKENDKKNREILLYNLVAKKKLEKNVEWYEHIRVEVGKEENLEDELEKAWRLYIVNDLHTSQKVINSYFLKFPKDKSALCLINKLKGREEEIKKQMEIKEDKTD